VSRPTRGFSRPCPVRGCHPLRRAVPGASGTSQENHWPRPLSLATTDGVSGALLSQSTILMSFPPATEMFQFAGFASLAYGFSQGYPHGWVAPFGDPGINDRSHLPRAFRSVPRPSSPLSAKASTRCPYSTRFAQQNPPPTGTSPAGDISLEDTLPQGRDHGSGIRHQTTPRPDPRPTASVTLSLHPVKEPAGNQSRRQTICPRSLSPAF
jgi:hypothetical protein